MFVNYKIEGVDWVGMGGSFSADTFNALRNNAINSFGVRGLDVSNMYTSDPDEKIQIDASLLKMSQGPAQDPASAINVDVEFSLPYAAVYGSDLLAMTYSGDLCTGGTASASDTQAGSPASNAFDNNTGTLWVSNTTMSSGSHWLKYDLGVGNAEVFRKVWVYWYAANNTPTTMKIQGSNNDSTWTDLATVSPARAGAGWEGFEFANSTAYRYLRLEATAGGAYLMAVAEVQGLSYLTAANAIDTSSGDPENVFDGSTATNWYSNTTMSAGSPWIEFDLGVGNSAVFRKLRAYWIDANHTPGTITISVSADGVYYTNLATGISTTATSGWESFEFANPSTSGRFVRLTSASGGAYPLALAEMEAMEIVTEALNEGDPGCFDENSTATADTWYCLWAIGKCAAEDNVITDAAALASSSFTSPALPSGYTHKRRVSCFYIDSAGDIKPFYQHEWYWGYIGAQLISTRTGSSGWVEEDVSGYFCKEMGVMAEVLLRGDALAANEGETYIRVHGETDYLGSVDTDNSEETQLLLQMRIVDNTIDWQVNSTTGSIQGNLYMMGFIIPVWEEVQ